MDKFKILRGNSSRIDTSITPFQDGYAYFTPDDGGFYIDAEESGEQKRIRINPSEGDPSLLITSVLSSSEWTDEGKQTVSVSGLGKDQNGIVGISQSITDEQFAVLASAGLYVDSQEEEAITIAAAGEIPNCDIPIAILIFPGGNVSGASIESGVASFNGRMGAVLPQTGDYTAEMVGALPSNTTIPKKISELTNDSKFVAEEAFTSHTSDTDIHVTASEKEEWSGKQEALTAGTDGQVLTYDGTNNKWTAKDIEKDIFVATIPLEGGEIAGTTFEELKTAYDAGKILFARPSSELSADDYYIDYILPLGYVDSDDNGEPITFGFTGIDYIGGNTVSIIEWYCGVNNWNDGGAIPIAAPSNDPTATDGQILSKTTDGTEWIDAPETDLTGYTKPTNTGTTGQVLTKTSTGSEWADASGGDISSVIGRTTNVDAADTNYSTLMARGEKLLDATTFDAVTDWSTVLVNGAICWRYE